MVHLRIMSCRCVSLKRNRNFTGHRFKLFKLHLSKWPKITFPPFYSAKSLLHSANPSASPINANQGFIGYLYKITKSKFTHFLLSVLFSSLSDSLLNALSASYKLTFCCINWACTLIWIRFIFWRSTWSEMEQWPWHQVLAEGLRFCLCFKNEDHTHILLWFKSLHGLHSSIKNFFLLNQNHCFGENPKA